MATATKILGLAKLHKKLQRMPEVAKKQIKAAMEKSADEVVAMMRSLVPVDEGVLRDSIGWTWGKLPKGKRGLGGATAVASVEASLGGELTITIYAGGGDAWHARFVEFGTRPKAAAAPQQDRRYKKRVVLTKSSRGHAGTTAQPFFYISYRANKKRAVSRTRRAVNKAAKEVASS